MKVTTLIDPAQLVITLITVNEGPVAKIGSRFVCPELSVDEVRPGF